MDILELMGSEYVIDHVVAEHNSRMKEEIFRNYVCDISKVLTEIWGASINTRYSDLISVEEPEEEKTGDEVALEVIRRAGLKARNDESI